SGPDLTCDAAILTGALAAAAGVWGACAVAATPRSPAAATAKATFRMIKKYRAREGGSEAFCRLTLSRIVMYWSKASCGQNRAARVRYSEFTELFGRRDRM